MSFAQRIIYQAHQVSEGDFEELRKYGLSDEEILDVILASAARSFIGKALDAVGIKPNTALTKLEPARVRLLDTIVLFH